MARAGMTRWRSRNCASANDRCDEVQKSLDLLDRVLSEFDDCDTNNSEGDRAAVNKFGIEAKDEVQPSLKNCETPEDESPSGLGGHQSEDDGYMSMNGRKAKLLLTSSTSSSNDFTNGDNDEVSTPETPPPICEKKCKSRENGDFPPPPEEAQRIISTLLPRVSSCSSSECNRKCGKENVKNIFVSFDENVELNRNGVGVTTATQTTLPMTKHQRPYGWQKDARGHFHNTPLQPSVPKTNSKYRSLPSDGVLHKENHSSPWSQYAPSHVAIPRTVPIPLERHRDVRRCAVSEEAALNTVQEIADDDPANFSDDSLEHVSSLPTAEAHKQPEHHHPNKRGGIAWEVSLESDGETSIVATTTKVVSKRKKSADYSSTGSLNNLNLYDDWPEPPSGPEESLNALTSDTDDVDSLTADNYVSEMPVSTKSYNGGTYVIRKANKKDRLQLFSETKTATKCQEMKLPTVRSEEVDLKRCSSTFDNIKTLLKEGLIEGLDDSPPDFQPPRPPFLSRGLSLPNIMNEDVYEEESKTSFINNGNESVSSLEQLLENNSAKVNGSCEASTKENNYVSKSSWTECDKIDYVEKQSVAVQVSADFTLLNKEIAEQSTSCQTDNEELNYCVTKAIDTAENITSTGTFKRDRKPETTEAAEAEDQVNSFAEVNEVREQESVLNIQEKRKDMNLEIAKQEIIAEPWSSTKVIPEIRKVPVKEKNDYKEFEKPYGDFRVNVEILQHEFGPLPPSPVEEVDDEYSDVLQSVPTNRKSDSLTNDLAYRRNSRLSGSGSSRSNRSSDIPPHRDQNSSLKTRSVDAGFTRNHRTHFLSSRKEVPVERRTLPNDLPGTSHRRPFHKRGIQSPKDENSHFSCSLPETPIFARGCDIPRTPLRSNTATAEKTSTIRTTPRLNGIQTSGYKRNVGAGHGTCLGEAMAGAELLRLTGPGRGWYPRHRQPRPASVEHLDRLTPQALSPSAPAGGVWETRESRKPFTLPPNLSPKFFQRSPREALRRVTSLLIRKGGNSKDMKSKDVLASSVIGPHDHKSCKKNHRRQKQSNHKSAFRAHEISVRRRSNRKEDFSEDSGKDRDITRWTNNSGGQALLLRPPNGVHVLPSVAIVAKSGSSA